MNLHSRFLATTLLLATVPFASAAQAATFEQFDRMSIEAQSEFVAVMIDTTENALRADGRPDFAAQVEHLFTTVEPGDSMPMGLVEYVRNEAIARESDAKHAIDHPNDPRLDVEDALFVTLKKNGIVMSDKAMNAVDASLANFHAETYAEFEAKSQAEQRRYIALLFKFAWPDYVFRDDAQSRIRSHKGGMFSDPAEKRNMLALVSTQFPTNSTDQPGFYDLAKEIKAGTRPPKKDGPFFVITIYVLQQLDAQVVKKIGAMVNWSVLLPDGRHAYVADDGVFWVVPDDDSKYKKGSSYKLEANLQPLAQRLSHCMESSGIADGARAQTVCLQHVAGVSPPSTEPAAAAQNKADLRRLCGEIVLSNGRRVLHVEQGESFDEAMKKFQECIGPNGTEPTNPAPATAPAAPPPPAAAPASPPANSTDDDPFGGGGFITPPTNFNALLCVSADLASNSEWSNPAGGSKMDTFKHRVGSYVNSVAKPGWEYWIMPGQYERFDPATTSSGAQFVSVVSPDSGRFDEFNPKCPSGYAAFWVKVSH